ncbi:MAG: phosphate acyltransferase PlsX [Firmicutes bacterium]|nr:phosphate acyltransferase PlsX [Bacillota bacterium]
MKIAVDVMGGDNAPKAVIEGCVEAMREYDIDIYLVGLKKDIEDNLGPNIGNSKIHIVEAQEIIKNDDAPVNAIRRKKNSSLVLGLQLVKNNNCDAFLSAGNTGAFLAGSLLRVGRIKGIDRPALAPILPSTNGGFMLLDAGANVDCKPINIFQFALMGSVYMERIVGIAEPRVGLLSNGSEEGKGNDLTKQSFELLKESNLNFIGNIEARDIVSGICDVCVCDGFVGNIVLKNTEGLASGMMSMIKEEINKSFLSKIGAILMKNSFVGLKKRFDYKEYGGAPFLGISGIMIKAHGSSDKKAIKNAIRQAKLLYDNSYIQLINKGINETGVV